MSTNASPNQPSVDSKFRPLRIWFPLIVLPLMIVARFVPDYWTDGPPWTWAISAFVPLLLSLGLLVWWLTLSRARAGERIIGLLAIIAILVVEQMIAHETMGGPAFMVVTIPTTIAAFALGLVLFGNVLSSRRTGIAVGLAAMAAMVSTLLRSEGVRGDFSFELLPRWQKTSDELVNAVERPGQSQAIPSDTQLTSTWPRFRGPRQDGVVQNGMVIDADWDARPPKQLWRITVGPAWSSFISVDKYLFTQEQRGEDEAVVCYDSESGQQVWAHTWPTRFFEGLGGLGPRATPAYADGFIYALGAAGKLVKLDVHDGSPKWDIDLKEAAERKEPPMWGFSSSPLVLGDKVIVHAGGNGNFGILAFDVNDHSLAWSAPTGQQSYGSVQSVNVLGKEYLALLSDLGASLWDLTGQSVLEINWPHQGYRALQPQIIDGDKLLIPTGMGTGTRLVKLSEQDGKLLSEEIWTSRDLNPTLAMSSYIKDTSTASITASLLASTLKQASVNGRAAITARDRRCSALIRI